MSKKHITNYSNLDIVREILDKTEEELENMTPVNILVVGKTGVGKSTLINSLFRENLATTGIGKPVTQYLTKITKEGMPIQLYDTRGLELNPDVQKQVKKEINDLYNETKDTEDEIHVVYYVINGNSSRIEPLEEDMVRSFSEKMPVLIVLTQSIGEPAEEFKDFIENQDLPVEDVINIMAKDYKISEDYIIKEFGLKKLIQRTIDVIPDDAERAFNNAQHADIARKAKAARSWARGYIGTSFGVGFLPVPFSDAALLVPMQITLIAHITSIFGISMDKRTLISIIAAVGGTGGATYLGRSIVTNLMKFFPGAGSISGGVISATTAATLTSALGMSYIEVLVILSRAEKDGKIRDISNIDELMREKFAEYLSRRKEVTSKEDLERIADEEIDNLEENVEKAENKQVSGEDAEESQNLLNKIKGFMKW